jgi:hypothetical protein
MRTEKSMRKRWLAAALALLGAVAVAQTDSAAFVGTWNGTWEGGGTGRFDLTIERNGDGQPAGGVSVGTEQGDYTAKFKELSFDGQNMQARYEFPLDGQADVTVTGTFNGGSAEGTWNLVAKGGDQSFAGGTWKVAKK